MNMHGSADRSFGGRGVQETFVVAEKTSYKNGSLKK